MGKEKKSQWGKNLVLFLVLVVSAVAIKAFYNLGSSNTFTSETRKIRETAETIKQAAKETEQKATNDKKADEQNLKFKAEDIKIQESESKKDFGAEKQNTLKKESVMVQAEKKIVKDSKSASKTDPITKPINVIITFTKAGYNIRLQQKFRLTVSSLLEHAKAFVKLHILGEPESQALGAEIVDEESKKIKNNKFELVKLDIDDVISKLNEIVLPMQEHFSSKPGSYYSDALFFLSIAIHKILPASYDKIIMLDSDLKFVSDIGDLYRLFNQFTKENMIGIGHDLQPVYRHTFWEYRNKNPGTRVGEPKPKGLQGFNSGVLLLDLNKLRASTLYNSLLNKKSMTELTKEFYFQGHLGDQDFFTLLSMKYENLFYVLPCGWNRQLCEWWKNKGYESVWDSYFSCDTPTHIYHGNCNTQIP